MPKVSNIIHSALSTHPDLWNISPIMHLQEITEKIRRFRDERDWAQFHNPKDMAMALSIEASELMEQFLWKNQEEVAARLVEKREEIEDEVADVAIYLVELADILGIDLFDAMERKMNKNAAKYPADRVRGSSLKYNEYGADGATGISP